MVVATGMPMTNGMGMPMTCIFCAHASSHGHAHDYSHRRAYDYVHGHVYYWQTRLRGPQKGLSRPKRALLGALGVPYRSVKGPKHVIWMRPNQTQCVEVFWTPVAILHICHFFYTTTI